MLSKEGNSFKFSISDHGVGIPSDELSSIFEPFAQSSKTKTKAGGTGLGLAICREIISGHRGKIWAENAKAGGAIFNFTLPLKQSSKFSKLDNKAIDNNTEPHLLLIDDEEVCLAGLELILSNQGYCFRKAYGGLEGLEMIKASSDSIEAVLLDIMMPDLSGIEVLKAIRKDKKLKHLKVIIQSGTSDEALIKQVKFLGIEGYISKPYDRAKVIATVKNLWD